MSSYHSIKQWAIEAKELLAKGALEGVKVNLTMIQNQADEEIQETFEDFKRESPSKCFSCGKITVYPKKIAYDACIKHGGQLHYFHIKDLNIFECKECHDQEFGSAADNQLTSALRVHLLKCKGSCHK